MKKTPSSTGRTRAEILASIANLPDSVQGSISSYNVTTSSGKTITYHKLQYWADGRNHAVHIPKEKLPDFEAAAENGRRLRELLAELTEAVTLDILCLLQMVVHGLLKCSRPAPMDDRHGRHMAEIGVI